MTSHILTRTAFAAAASLAVVVPLAGCSGSHASAPPRPASTPVVSSPRAGTSSSNAEYKDGTYTARGVYGGAPSYLTVTIALRADTITAVTVEPMPDNNDTSRGYQERFAAAVPNEVIGKSIDEVKVGKLAGASGCADGFNDAVAKIRDQARPATEEGRKMAEQMSTVLAVGATGSIGRLVVAEALGAGYETRALVRDRARGRTAFPTARRSSSVT